MKRSWWLTIRRVSLWVTCAAHFGLWDQSSGTLCKICPGRCSCQERLQRELVEWLHHMLIVRLRQFFTV